MALRVDSLEEVIDDLCDLVKTHHVERVSKQECSIENGFVLNDMLTDYERISDHCSNVAEDVLESVTGDMWMHEFHSRPEFRENKLFRQYFDEYSEKYAV